MFKIQKWNMAWLIYTLLHGSWDPQDLQKIKANNGQAGSGTHSEHNLAEALPAGGGKAGG